MHKSQLAYVDARPATCCIQLYHPSAPIHYVYGNETITLHRKGRALQANVDYALLLRNGGNEPIETVNVLYPRSLYQGDRRTLKVSRIGLVQQEQQIAAILPQLSFGAVRGDLKAVHLSIPNPQDPVVDIVLPIGDYGIENDRLDSPAMGQQEIETLKFWDLTFLQLTLGTKWAAGECRWFFFSVCHELMGINSVKGRISHLQVASPMEVRNLAWELVQNAKNKAAASPYKDDLLRFFASLAVTLGIVESHSFAIGLYELNLKAGDPRQCLVDFFHLERDIYARSDSPRHDAEGNTLTYQFRSGERLGMEPFAGKGFHAFFQILWS